MAKRINNHLRKGYSKYNLLFLKRYHSKLELDNKILDVGCGHYRNLRLFYEIGFKELYGVDKNVPEPIFKDKRFKINFKMMDIEKGLPYENKYFDVVLCNYVLMFIYPNKLNFVLDELLRVTKRFCIIETLKPSYEALNGDIKDYRFSDIVEYIKNNEEFEILDQKNYYERLTIRRVIHG